MFETTNDDAKKPVNEAVQDGDTGTPVNAPGADNGDGQDGGDVEGLEIVLADSESTPDDPNRPLTHNELNAKRRLARKREKQLRQQREAFKRGEIPDDLKVAPEEVPQPVWDDYLKKHDYDTEAASAEYSADLQKWSLKQLDARSVAATKQQRMLSDFDANSEKQLKLASDFYAKAEKLAVDDFDEKEEAFRAVGLDGLDNHLMERWPDKAPAVVYHLGANPEKAAYLKQLLQADPIGATIYITEMVSKLKLQPKRRSAAPDPDDGISGGAGGSIKSAEDYQKLADKAAEDGDTEKYLIYRKKVKELSRGVK